MAVPAFAAVVWAYWKRRDPALSRALFVTATFLVTPYILNYDMVVFGFDRRGRLHARLLRPLPRRIQRY